MCKQKEEAKGAGRPVQENKVKFTYISGSNRISRAKENSQPGNQLTCRGPTGCYELLMCGVWVSPNMVLSIDVKYFYFSESVFA